jgi:molecular chaperone DnaJ
LARQHHPDVDKSAGAADRFKEVSEAYQVLSDPQKKQSYDQFGHASTQGGFGGAGGGNPFGEGFNPFGQGGFQYQWSSQGGDPNMDFSDPFDLFNQIFGMTELATVVGARRKLRLLAGCTSLLVLFLPSLPADDECFACHGE